MKIYLNPVRENWKALVKRPQLELEFLDSGVKNILGRVQKSGDQALFELTKQYDKADLSGLLVSQEEIEAATNKISPELKRAIEIAASNIEKFHANQKQTNSTVETTPGVTCWRKS